MENPGRWPWTVVLAAMVVVVAGMKAASGLLEPFLIAIFISIVCAPAVASLRRIGCPEALAVGGVMLALVAFMAAAAVAVGASVNGFIRSLPEYREVLDLRLEGVYQWLAAHGMDVEAGGLGQQLDPGMLMNLAGQVAGHFSTVLGNLFLVLLTVAFILLEAARFPAKLQAALGDAGAGLAAFNRFAAGVNQYLAIKSLVSLATGALVVLWMWWLEVDYPLLWGALAFLFNYIPNIGSFLAAIPACLLAFVLHGTGPALLAAGGFAVINTVMGSLLEPRLMGRSLGLSTLVVFLSMVFWGWVLGPVGMVLSVPLTMILRIALESHSHTRWLAVLLGPEVSEWTAGGSGAGREAVEK